MKYKKDKSKVYKTFVNLSKLPQESSVTVKLGKIAETNKPAFFDLNQLKTHVLIAGTTGSGKSITAQDLVEEALMKNIAVLIFDPTAQWTGFLRKNEDKEMFKYYPRFNMKKSDARGFNGNIKIVKDPTESIDIKKCVVPGQATIFCMNYLKSSEIDLMVASTIQQIFDSNLEESRDLKILLVYDEVHRLLPKFGGAGKGMLQLERACREFRKWGVGLVLVSQILKDFVEDIHANIGTEIQMKTKHIEDLKRITEKYGEKLLQILNKVPAGTGMVENSAYNEGKPYFVSFRPILHSTFRLSDKELQQYDGYNTKLEDISYQLDKLKDLSQDIFDLEMELKLAHDKLQQGKFNMVDIYLESLTPKVESVWKKLGKQPVHKEVKKIDLSKIHAGIEEAKAQRETTIKRDDQIKKVVQILLDRGFTLEQIKAEFIKRKYPEDIIDQTLKQFKKDPLEDLRNYIERALKEGFTLDQIKTELIKAGWSQKDIDSILSGLKEKKEV